MSSALTVLYGGTFDPIHLGHLHIARAARDRLQATVSLMPAADPPHRELTGANAAQRLAMVRLAVADETGLQVDARELERDEPSYTVETLRQWRAQHGKERPLAILIGADSFLSLPSWYRWQELADLAHLVIAERPRHHTETSQSPELRQAYAERFTDRAQDLSGRPAGLALRLLQSEMDLSATRIRREIAAGGPEWRLGVKPAVARYIEQHGLYGCPQGLRADIH